MGLFKSIADVSSCFFYLLHKAQLEKVEKDKVRKRHTTPCALAHHVVYWFAQQVRDLGSTPKGSIVYIVYIYSIY